MSSTLSNLRLVVRLLPSHTPPRIPHTYHTPTSWLHTSSLRRTGRTSAPIGRTFNNPSDPTTSAASLPPLNTSPSTPPSPNPPSHDLESSSKKKSKRSRTYRLSRALAVLGGLGVVAWQADEWLYDSTLTRSSRTLWMGFITTLDFKLNFTPTNSSKIDALHQRVATRLKDLVAENQGLYIKMGQALGLQAALLPKPYKEAFANIFDAAPSIPYPLIRQVFIEDFGKPPEEIFEEFAEEPIASASIAQVHKAVIRRYETDKEGRRKVGGKEWREVVAVKVQKPAIRKQMEWDLWSYRTMMGLAEWIFEMPMSFIAQYVSDQMRLETSFLNEASNSVRCAEYLADTPELRNKVYVPKVYAEVAASDRVMVMEYVEGCRLNQGERIEAMGFTTREVMDTVIEVASAMTFTWGFVHCDPHPGNILIQRHPDNPKKPRVVLLDHGLYITLSQKFKEQYCTLWRSLFVLDIRSIQRIATEWGISLDVNMFASAILLRPFKVTQSKDSDSANTPKPTHYEQQMELKKRLKTMLESEELIPRELIFIGRAQRMMQANNQMLGSPSPRINITAHWAAIGYQRSILSLQDRSFRAVGLRGWLRDRVDLVVFRLALLVLDINFLSVRIRQWWNEGKSKKSEGWESELQHQFEQMAKDELGIEIDDTVFLG